MKNFFLNRKELKENKNSEDVPINPYEDEWKITWDFNISIPNISIPSDITIVHPPSTIIFVP